MDENKKLIKGLGLDLTRLDNDIKLANEKLKNLGKDQLKLKVNLDIDKETLGSLKTIVDALKEVEQTTQDSFNKAGNSTRKAAKELNDYQQFLKEIIHLYKTQELDARSFVQLGSELRTNKAAWGSLSAKEQETLVKTLISAEKELASVLKEEHNILQGNAKQVLDTADAWQAYYKQIYNIGTVSKSAKESASVFNQEFKEQEEIIKRSKSYWDDVNKSIFGIGQTYKSAKESASVFNEVFKEQERYTNEYNTLLNASLGNKDNFFSLTNLEHKIANSLIYGTTYRLQQALISGFSEGIKTIKQYEYGVNDLRRTLEDVTEQELKNFGELAMKYAKDFGIELKDVQKAMTELARAGVTKEDLGQMTENVLMGLNTTEVEDADEMVGYLVSTVKQLKMEMKDAGIIIDSWNKLADKYAVQTDDFAKAMQRAGAASRLLGLNLHDINAMTVILGEATQASGEMVGQALKSLEVRLLRPETVKTLESYGIAVKKNEKEFLTFKEIMSNVNKEIADLEEGSVKLNAIMDALGGSWRKNWIQILADDWNRFDEIVTESMSSIGYSIRENEKVMDTYAKKIESMKNAWREVFVKFIEESGLLNFLKWATDGLSSFATVLSKINGSAYQVILIMSALGATILALNQALKLTANTSIIEWIMQIQAHFGAAKISVEGMAKAQELLDVAVKAGMISSEQSLIIQTALTNGRKVHMATTNAARVQEEAFATALKTSAASAIGLRLAIAGATLGLSLLITTIIQYIDTQKKSISQAAERSKKFKEEQKSIEDLKKQYIELKNSTDNSLESKSKLLEVENKLKEVLGESAKALDLQNGKIEENIALINQMSKAKMQDYIALHQVDYDTSKKFLETPKGLDLGWFYGYTYTGKTPEEELAQIIKDVQAINNDYETATADEKQIYDIQRKFLQKRAEELSNKIESAKQTIELYDAYKNQLNSNSNTPNDITEGSQSYTPTFTFESLKKLYSAGRLTDKEYISYLQGIIPLGYGSMSNEELSALLNDNILKDQVEQYLDIIQEIKRVQEKSSGGAGFIDASPSLLKKDRYAQLEAELNKIDILLEKNKALQELNQNDKTLLDEEIKLLKQKQEQLHIINQERRRERDELIKTLSAQGFKFTGEGDSAAIVNYVEVISKLTDEVNKHRNDKDKTYYNTLKQRLDEAQNNAKRFFELQINEINKTSNEWWKLQKAIADVDNEIQDLIINQHKETQKVNDELLKIYENVNKQIVDALKERYDQEKKLRQRNHEDEIKRLDEKYRKFEEYINAQLKLLDEQYSEEDFLQQLTKERDIANEIQKQINELMLDDSTEARTKVFELNKKLTEQEEKIAKLKNDRERDMRRKNLQDQLNSYKNHIDEQKRLENESFEEFSRRIEDVTEKTALALEAEKFLMTGTIEDVQNALIDLFTQTGINATEAGRLIQSEILDKLALVRDIGNNLETIKGGSSGNNPLGMSREDFATYLANKREFEYGNPSEARKAELRAANEELRRRYGITSDTYSYDQLKGYYDEGGLALGKGILLKNTLAPERVLSPAQTKSFDRLVDILGKMPELKVSIPSLMMPSLGFAGSPISIDASIYVEGSVDRSFWSQFKQAQENQIERIVKHLTIPTVRRGSI